MVRKVLILAGGKGTRLRSVVNDVPKPMAPINGTPFLAIILGQLSAADFTKVIISIGYKADYIINHFGNEYRGLSIEYIVEDEPLGTGGAIKNALENEDGPVLIINGDTYCEYTKLDIELNENSIYCKHVNDTSRYGEIVFNQDYKIISFNSNEGGAGFVSLGIYFLMKPSNICYPLEQCFSWEKFLEQAINPLNMYAVEYDGAFIDIGIPEDYQAMKAYHESIISG
ncbi:sugar phosphate nucleotidyltransferase [Gammaproteobacteria bacterium]|nr:sugar phosphate nucleotidyltransferase [Gammaproteobacteria bacterium]